MPKVSKSERDAALARLHKWISPGNTVYTILRHVSRSGMQRRISVVLLQVDDTDARVGMVAGHRPKLIDLHPNHAVATACGFRLASGAHDAIVMGGCGMDMGFALVYELSAALYPEGFGCIGKGCPSNDHSNGDRDYTLHGCTDENGRPENREPGVGEQADGCRAHWHRDGGYALRQRWI